VNAKRQTMLFSATLDGDVDVLIKHYQTNPAHHEAISMEEQGEVTHRFWSVSHADRIAIATAIVERSWPAIVFSRTRHGAERLSKQLNKAGVRSEAIHGDRSQSQRERALAAFGRGDVHVLVATDVAARGIHVDGVTCVLQYDPPATDKDYVHRSGRTGRAGEAGSVITFVSPEKEKDVRKMQRELRRREPIEVATVATAATILASAPPKPIDRGDDLDGVSRRERARADDRPRPERTGHRKGQGGSTAGPKRQDGRRFESKDGRPSDGGAKGEWTPRGRAPRPAGQAQSTRGSAPSAANGQERAGTPARSGRPGAKPGRRPAGAGAARPGRPAGGNARRRSR
jgi:superfamily II DNA/RNA helicase